MQSLVLKILRTERLNVPNRTTMRHILDDMTLFILDDNDFIYRTVCILHKFLYTSSIYFKFYGWL